MSFKEYLQAQGKSHSTITHYNRCIDWFLNWLQQDGQEPENVTAKEIMTYLGYLQKKGLSNKVRSQRLGVIHHYFHYLIDRGDRTTHPSQQIKLKGTGGLKLYPVLTREQLEALHLNYELVPEDDKRANRNWFREYALSRQRNKVIIGLMIWQGITTAEVAKIELNDLDLRAGTLRVKGGRKSNERVLDIKPGQVLDLLEYQLTTRAEIAKYHTKPVEALFLSLPAASSKVAGTSFDIWKPLRAEIRERNPFFISFWQVRTSVIVSWLNTHNLRQVQYMAGHRFVSSTEKYLLHQIEDLQNDIDKFHPLG